MGGSQPVTVLANEIEVQSVRSCVCVDVEPFGYEKRRGPSRDSSDRVRRDDQVDQVMCRC